MYRALLIVVGASGILAALQLAAGQELQTTQTFSGTGGPLGQLTLLQVSAVQDELKLTDQQRVEVQQLVEDQNAWFDSVRQVPPGERQTKTAERSRVLEGLIGRIVTGDQRQRLKQLSLQQSGGWALADPETAAAIALTVEQIEQVQAITTSARFKMRGLGRRGPRRPPADDMAAIRQETSDKLLGLLTDEQQSKWKSLVGDPFALER